MRRSPLKRTGFKRKIKEGSGETKKNFKKSKPINPLGKKGREWQGARKQLKLFFENATIMECELKYENCTKDDFLTWAHSLKRRYIDRNSGRGDQLLECILACQNCHQRIEFLPKEQMEQIVLEIIKNRKVKI